MTVEQLYTELVNGFQLLADTGKIFFDHIDVEDGSEVLPPYMVLTETEKDPFYADNKVFYMTIRHTLDVYTATYDEEFINGAVDFLNELSLSFSVVPVECLDDLGTYLTTFEIDLDPTESEES